MLLLFLLLLLLLYLLLLLLLFVCYTGWTFYSPMYDILSIHKIGDSILARNTQYFSYEWKDGLSDYICICSETILDYLPNQHIYTTKMKKLDSIVFLYRYVC
jgi:hypothetical protein